MMDAHFHLTALAVTNAATDNVPAEVGQAAAAHFHLTALLGLAVNQTRASPADSAEMLLHFVVVR